MTRYTVDVKPGGGGDFSGLFAALAIVFVPLLLCAGLISLITGGSSPVGVEEGKIIGKKEAFNLKPIPVEKRPNPDVQQTDPFNWEVTFSKPGCTEPVIDTGLPLGPGNTYFVRTERTIENFQIGSLRNGGLRPWINDPECFNQKNGFPIWGTTIAVGKTLAIVTDAIPPGSYWVYIRKSAFTTLRSGEIAPGVFTDKPVRQQ